MKNLMMRDAVISLTERWCGDDNIRFHLKTELKIISQNNRYKQNQKGLTLASLLGMDCKCDVWCLGPAFISGFRSGFSCGFRCGFRVRIASITTSLPLVSPRSNHSTVIDRVSMLTPDTIAE